MTALALAELRRRAEEYAAGLKPGDEVHDDIDGSTIETFRHLLPAALARRGLRPVLIDARDRRGGCGVMVSNDPRAFCRLGPDHAGRHLIDDQWRIEADDAEPETVEAPAMTIQQLHDLDPDNRFQGRNQ